MKINNVSVTEKMIGYVFGIIFIFLLLALVFFIPDPSRLQTKVINTILALAAGGFAMLISGTITVNIPGYIKAGGALAITVLILVSDPITDLATNGKLRAWHDLDISNVAFGQDVYSNNEANGMKISGILSVNISDNKMKVDIDSVEFKQIDYDHVSISGARLVLRCFQEDKVTYRYIGSRVTIEQELKQGDVVQEKDLTFTLVRPDSNLSLNECMIEIEFLMRSGKAPEGYKPAGTQQIFNKI